MEFLLAGAGGRRAAREVGQYVVVRHGPQSGLGGCEVRGVDDLGLGVQPRAGRPGVALQILETERGVGAKHGAARVTHT